MSARGLRYLSKPENGEKKHAATAPKRNRMGSFFFPTKIHTDTHRRLLISLELAAIDVPTM